MTLQRTLSVALLCTGLGFGAAQAQSTSITTGPNGQLSGTASAGNAPSVSIGAGNGQVGGVVTPDPGMSGGHGRSMSVHSPNGSASTSVWTSGPGTTAVAGAGSPGSTITTSDDERPRAASYHRTRHHARRSRHRRHKR